ncbi:DUF917 domain-containing protein [Bacillus sp. sid0103]|uniref:DUF917 domain-containing protein n=1 Tax=Bacillus sp. sid0103 TaxID=2856337 RepID=UPI001C4548E3|nr:DUF917 domain-containing protein [Bacillus sp. sid0103]MBV7504852.1 DUF917 domain-containing protein [Bacillus sp. sid0103]
MGKWIGEEEIEDLAVGAAILGTGGGGDPYLGKLMVQKAIRKNGPILLLDPSEVPDEETVIPTAMMGAPTIMVEKIPNGDEALKSLRLLEEFTGRKAFATMPIECGGLNSTIPFVVASEAGIPIVDGDGMGRAFPELQMETFHIYGVKGTPMGLHNERGDRVMLDTLDNEMLEHISRGIAVRMGGVAHIADYIMSGEEVKRTAIPNTLSLCMEIGKAVRTAQRQKIDPIKAIKAVTKSSIYGEAIVLFKGKIVDVERRSTDGFVRGKTEIEGFDEFEGKLLQVDFQNENLIAEIDSVPVAMVPDLISFLDMETGSPITTEGLKYGFRVVCIGIPTPEIMRSEPALKVWGPRYFGYDYDYKRLEEIHKGKVNAQ